MLDSKKHKKTIIWFLALLAIAIISILIFASSYQLVIKKANAKVTNETGRIIPSEVYAFKDEDNEGNNFERYHIIIGKKNSDTHLVIVPYKRLVGILEGVNPIATSIGDYALLKKASLKFTPVNEGFYKEDISVVFKTNQVELTTYHDLYKFGKKLFITFH